jgi:hypothetical protein
MVNNDEAEIRKDFKYAKNAGFPLIVVAQSHESLDTVEKLAKTIGSIRPPRGYDNARSQAPLSASPLTTVWAERAIF